ncbi:MAG: hypothetical protein WCB19_03755 [Thermoplasmata archaeon]
MMNVAIASQCWDTPEASFYTHSREVLAAALSAGVEARPMRLRSLRAIRTGGLVLPWARRWVDRYPRGAGEVVHHIDQDAFIGIDVATVHDLGCFHDPSVAARFARSAVRAVTRRARRIVVTTRGTADELSTVFPRAPAADVVPVPHASVRPGLEQPCRFDALWVGRNAPHKRAAEYVRLAARWPRLAFAMRLSASPSRPLMDGLGPLLPLRNLTLLTEPMTEAEMDALYRQSRVVVSTSTYEGYHRPPLEGYLRGCRVVLPRTEPYLSTYPEDAVFWYSRGAARADPESLDSALEDAIGRTEPAMPDSSVVRAVSYETTGAALRGVYEGASRA